MFLCRSPRISHTDAYVSWLLTLQIRPPPLLNLFTPPHLFLLSFPNTLNCTPVTGIFFSPYVIIFLFPHAILSLLFLVCQQSPITVSQRHAEHVQEHEVFVSGSRLYLATLPLLFQCVAHVCAVTFVWQCENITSHGDTVREALVFVFQLEV